MKKFVYLCSALFGLALASCAGAGNQGEAAGEQSIFDKYERYLVEPRSYICYRTEGNLNIDGKLDEASWQKARPIPVNGTTSVCVKSPTRSVPSSW